MTDTADKCYPLGGLYSSTDEPPFLAINTDSSSLSRIMMARRLRNVKRYSRLFMVREHTVSEHSYQYVVMCTEVFGEMVRAKLISENDALQALAAAVYHDLDESVTGDIPYDLKAAMSEKAMRGIRKAARKIASGIHTGYELHGCDSLMRIKDVLHYLDMVELVFTLAEERELSTHADVKEVMKRGVVICCEMYDLLDDATQDLCSIHDIHAEVLALASRFGIH